MFGLAPIYGLTSCTKSSYTPSYKMEISRTGEQSYKTEISRIGEHSRTTLLGMQESIKPCNEIKQSIQRTFSENVSLDLHHICMYVIFAFLLKPPCYDWETFVENALQKNIICLITGNVCGKSTTEGHYLPSSGTLLWKKHYRRT